MTCPIETAIAAAGSGGLKYEALLEEGLKAGLNSDQSLIEAEKLTHGPHAKVCRVFMDEGTQLTEEEVLNLLKHLREREHPPLAGCKVRYLIRP